MEIEQEARMMGLQLQADPETLANAPRGTTTTGQTSQYQYKNRTAHADSSDDDEDDDDHHLAHLDEESRAALDQYELETSGLGDRELDVLDGKTSSRLGANKMAQEKQQQQQQQLSTTAPYPERETGANTGPKGVMADQKYHRQQQLFEQRQQLKEYNARMLAKAPTTTTFREDVKAQRKEMRAQGLLEEDDLDTDEENEKKEREKEEEDREEQAVLERIRANRLQDMSWASKKTALGARATATSGGGGLVGKKMFGSLMEMNAAQYVGAIDGEKKEVTVVIHIYSEANPECKRLDECLIQLAAAYATTKFIRIKAREVDFDPEVCPTVLVYRAGDLIANLVMITYDLSDHYDSQELEEFFARNLVLSPQDRFQRETCFLDHDLERPSFSSISSSTGLLLEDDFMLGTRFGQMSMGSSSMGLGNGGGGVGRGILSGNVPEFRYQDYEDYEDEDSDYER